VRWEKREGTLWGVALFSQPAGPPMIFSGVFFIVNFVKVKLLPQPVNEPPFVLLLGKLKKYKAPEGQ
jgi:hypothetical protein